MRIYRACVSWKRALEFKITFRNTALGLVRNCGCRLFNASELLCLAFGVEGCGITRARQPVLRAGTRSSRVEGFRAYPKGPKDPITRYKILG